MSKHLIHLETQDKLDSTFLRLLSSLKGQCHKIFCFWFFSWISFPPAPEYSVKTISNFFENSRKFLQFKVHHRYQRHQRPIFPPVSLALLIPVANLPLVVSTIPAANLPPVSTTSVANLPPVLFTPVANNGSNYQTADNLKKVIYMLTPLPKGIQKKSKKHF